MVAAQKWKEAGSLQTWPRLLGWVGGWKGWAVEERRKLASPQVRGSFQFLLPREAEPPGTGPFWVGSAEGIRWTWPGQWSRDLELNLCLLTGKDTLRTLTVMEKDPFPVSILTKGWCHSTGKQFCDYHRMQRRSGGHTREEDPGGTLVL